jgi:hypothetical protein
MRPSPRLSVAERIAADLREQGFDGMLLKQLPVRGNGGHQAPYLKLTSGIGIAIS